jgi:hypothetical protein
MAVVARLGFDRLGPEALSRNWSTFCLRPRALRARRILGCVVPVPPSWVTRQQPGRRRASGFASECRIGVGASAVFKAFEKLGGRAHVIVKICGSKEESRASCAA